MSAAKKKVFYGWAYESPKGSLDTNVFPTKSEAFGFKDNYYGFKLVKVQVSKFVPKK